MVKNNESMNYVQEVFKSILEEEYLLCDLFNSSVDEGIMDLNELAKLSMIAQEPTLHRNEIEKLRKEDIMSNPYLANIKVPKVASQNFQLSNRRIIRSGLVTKYKSKSRDLSTMRQKNSYFICDYPLCFPGLTEGKSNTCWMTVEPFEIETFKEFIEEAQGDVLLIGCGLGYAAYMLSEKEEINSVTIIDYNQEVLDLFNEHILPQFKNKEKIQTVQGDGLEYLKQADLSIYDHVNVDVWYDTVDMIYPYLRCLEIEKENPDVKFSYWLEDELKEAIQKSLIAAVANDNQPYNNRVQHINDGFLLGIIGEDIVKKTPLNTYEDVYHLIDIDNIRDFLFCWYANNIETVEKQEPIDRRTINSTQGINSLNGMDNKKVYTKKEEK